MTLVPISGSFVLCLFSIFGMTDDDGSSEQAAADGGKITESHISFFLLYLPLDFVDFRDVIVSASFPFVCFCWGKTQSEPSKGRCQLPVRVRASFGRSSQKCRVMTFCSLPVPIHPLLRASDASPRTVFPGQNRS